MGLRKGMTGDIIFIGRAIVSVLVQLRKRVMGSRNSFCSTPLGSSLPKLFGPMGSEGESDREHPCVSTSGSPLSSIQLQHFAVECSWEDRRADEEY